jgi:hypothetical protein
MERKKMIFAAALIIFVMSSACFVTDLFSGATDAQNGGILANNSETISEDAKQTLESELERSLEESEETQVAFADLSVEQVQETVNAALGVDIEELKEEFLIPDNAIYIIGMEDMVNFQLMQPMSEVLDYYQIQFAREGLNLEEEHSGATAITTTLVYSGHTNGKMMVIELVALNEKQTSVNIQFED